MMLDEQIEKLADCLQTICSSLDEIKSQTETRSKAVLSISAKITNNLHALENEEDLSDEKAAQIAKEIAADRRKRREYKQYVEIADPIIVFMQENGEAMKKLRIAAEASQKMVRSSKAPEYFSRDEKQNSTEYISCNVKSQVDDGYKPPRPIFCITAGGLKIIFSSIGQAARAFLYSSGEIISCAKGFTDNIDGDKFSFIDKAISDPSVKSYSLARDALMKELKIRSEAKKFREKQEELIKAAQERQTALEPEKTEEKQNTPEPEPVVKRKTSARPVRGIADDGTTVEYPSIRAAGLALGCDITLVGKAIKGNYRAKGYRWEYI